MSSHDSPTTGGGPLPWARERGRPCAERRLSRQGNSLMFGMPKIFLRLLNLLPGDLVRITLYEEHGGVFVEPVMRRSQLPPPPIILPPVEVAK